MGRNESKRKSISCMHAVKAGIGYLKINELPSNDDRTSAKMKLTQLYAHSFVNMNILKADTTTRLDYVFRKILMLRNILMKVLIFETLRSIRRHPTLSKIDMYLHEAFD